MMASVLFILTFYITSAVIGVYTARQIKRIPKSGVYSLPRIKKVFMILIPMIMSSIFLIISMTLHDSVMSWVVISVSCYILLLLRHIGVTEPMRITFD